jgi:hypothetical protein
VCTKESAKGKTNRPRRKDLVFEGNHIFLSLLHYLPILGKKEKKKSWRENI